MEKKNLDEGSELFYGTMMVSLTQLCRIMCVLLIYNEMYIKC